MWHHHHHHHHHHRFHELHHWRHHRHHGWRRGPSCCLFFALPVFILPFLAVLALAALIF